MKGEGGHSLEYVTERRRWAKGLCAVVGAAALLLFVLFMAAVRESERFSFQQTITFSLGVCSTNGAYVACPRGELPPGLTLEADYLCTVWHSMEQSWLARVCSPQIRDVRVATMAVTPVKVLGTAPPLATVEPLAGELSVKHGGPPSFVPVKSESRVIHWLLLGWVCALVVLVGSIVWASMAVWRTLELDRRMVRGQCVQCGYPRADLPRCSECGLTH